MIFGTDPEYTIRPFNATGFTVEIGPDTYLSLPLITPYAGVEESAVTVNFPGFDDVTVRYYTNVCGWVTVGVFEDTCTFEIPEEYRATWGATTVQAIKDGMWHTFSDLIVGEEPLVLEVPTETITVTGITAACELALVQEDGVYRYAPATVGAATEFPVFDNGKKYEVQLLKPGSGPIQVPGINAGDTVDLSEWFK
jgi:hypothetical protein